MFSLGECEQGPPDRSAFQHFSICAEREHNQNTTRKEEELFTNLPKSGMTTFSGTDLSWILFITRREKVQDLRRQRTTQSFSLVCLFISSPVVHLPDLTVAFSSFSRCGILWLTPQCQCLVMGVDCQHSAQSHRLPFVRGSWVTFLSGQGAMFCLLWNFS